MPLPSRHDTQPPRRPLPVPHDIVQAELVLRTGWGDVRSRRRFFERSQFRLTETGWPGISDMVEYRHVYMIGEWLFIHMQRYAFEGFPSQSGEDFQADDRGNQHRPLDNLNYSYCSTLISPNDLSSCKGITMKRMKDPVPEIPDTSRSELMYGYFIARFGVHYDLVVDFCTSLTCTEKQRQNGVPLYISRGFGRISTRFRKTWTKNRSQKCIHVYKRDMNAASLTVPDKCTLRPRDIIV